MGGGTLSAHHSDCPLLLTELDILSVFVLLVRSCSPARELLGFLPSFVLSDGRVLHASDSEGLALWMKLVFLGDFFLLVEWHLPTLAATEGLGLYLV